MVVNLVPCRDSLPHQFTATLPVDLHPAMNLIRPGLLPEDLSHAMEHPQNRIRDIERRLFMPVLQKMLRTGNSTVSGTLQILQRALFISR